MVLKLENAKKLSTHEDNLLIHKSLGLFCFINFFYRFYNLIVNKTMLFKSNDNFTLVCIAAHGLLSVTSLIFRVPFQRHKGKPMIYKEFRLHSILFGLRSVLCFLSFYYKFSLFCNVAIVNLTMIGADITTFYLAAETKTMRGMPFGNNIKDDEQKNITRSNSAQQIPATLFMMVNIESAFCPLIAIQLAAFLMTLVRKNIIDEIDWHRIYAVSLWINVFVYNTFSLNEIIYLLLSINLFKYLRFEKKINKYLIWNAIIIPYAFTVENNINIINFYITSNNLEIIKKIIIYGYLACVYKETKPLWIIK